MLTLLYILFNQCDQRQRGPVFLLVKTILKHERPLLCALGHHILPISPADMGPFLPAKALGNRDFVHFWPLGWSINAHVGPPRCTLLISDHIPSMYPSYFRSHTISSLWGFTLGCLFWSQMALPFLLISTALLLSFFLVVSLWREVNCLLKLFIFLCLDDWWTFTRPWSSAS